MTIKKALVLSVALLATPLYANEILKNEIQKITGKSNARGPSLCDRRYFDEKWDKMTSVGPVSVSLSDFPPNIASLISSLPNQNMTLGKRKFNGNNTHYKNQLFAHTFNTREQPFKCCYLKEARIAAELKNSNNIDSLTGDNASDDRFYDFDNGVTTTNTSIDPRSPINPLPVGSSWTWWWRTVNINNVANGRYSFIISDDTDIKVAHLYRAYCCLKKDINTDYLTYKKKKFSERAILKQLTGDTPKKNIRQIFKRSNINQSMKPQ